MNYKHTKWAMKVISIFIFLVSFSMESRATNMTLNDLIDSFNYSFSNGSISVSNLKKGGQLFQDPTQSAVLLET